MLQTSTLLKDTLREERGPLYLKIATQMRRDIETGRWEPGHRLPALGAIAAELQVAVVTVRQAVAVLESEGLLVSRQGRGTFVTDDPRTRQWVVLGTDWNSLLRHLDGKKPRLLKVVDALAQPRLEEGDGRRAPAYRYMRRVHYRGEIAYAVIDIYLDRRAYRLAPKRFDTNMVISTLAEVPAARVRNLRQTFSFTTADLETASLLGVTVNAPIGDVRRVITDEDGTVLYVGETRYRGDFVKLQIDLQR